MTLKYYDNNSIHYFESTKDMDLSGFYAEFLNELPVNAYILDAGCGSGRDSKYFLQKGYRVFPIDGSAQLAKLASAYIGQDVYCMRFEEVDKFEAFDGIWSCASMLHVPRPQMVDIFHKFIWALKPGGVWYVSYKWGTGDREIDGRLFTDYNSTTFLNFIRQFPNIELAKWWRTEDLRKRGNDWLNAIIRKRE